MDWSIGGPVALHPSSEDWCGVTPPEPACHPLLSSCLPQQGGIHQFHMYIGHRRTPYTGQQGHVSKRKNSGCSVAAWLIAPHVQFGSKYALPQLPQTNTLQTKLACEINYSILYGGNNTNTFVCLNVPTLKFQIWRNDCSRYSSGNKHACPLTAKGRESLTHVFPTVFLFVHQMTCKGYPLWAHCLTQRSITITFLFYITISFIKNEILTSP